MKIPKQIKVGGHIIKVERHKENENDNLGFYTSFHEIVSVRDDLPIGSKATEVFLHEILEVIKMKYDIKIDHKDLNIVSEILFAIMRENNLNFGDDLND